jgi:hypothetical protein
VRGAVWPGSDLLDDFFEPVPELTGDLYEWGPGGNEVPEFGPFYETI